MDWLTVTTGFTHAKTIHTHGCCHREERFCRLALTGSTHQRIEVGVGALNRRSWPTVSPGGYWKYGRSYRTGQGVQFWFLSRTMRTVFSGSVWKNSSVSTHVPSSFSTRALTHGMSIDSMACERENNHTHMHTHMHPPPGPQLLIWNLSRLQTIWTDEIMEDTRQDVTIAVWVSPSDRVQPQLTSNTTRLS